MLVRSSTSLQRHYIRVDKTDKKSEKKRGSPSVRFLDLGWVKKTHTVQAAEVEQNRRIALHDKMPRIIYFARCAAFGPALLSSPPLQESKMVFPSLLVSLFPQKVRIICFLPFVFLWLPPKALSAGCFCPSPATPFDYNKSGISKRSC